MFKRLLSVVLLALAGEAFALSYADGGDYISSEREHGDHIVSDTLLFYRALHSADDLYARITAFDLPQVTIRRRGLGYDDGRIDVGGLPVDYRHAALLRLLGAGERENAGWSVVDGVAGALGGSRSFVFDDSPLHLPYMAQVRFSDRNYRVGARVRAARHWSGGWWGTVAVDGRTGRDMYTEGVYTNALNVVARAGHEISGNHRVALTVLVPLSERGLRLSSVDEAFVLTGDRLYNPAWGFQGGEVRNSRVRREAVPLIVADYHGTVAPETTVDVVAGVEFGSRRYSALGWYDTSTPVPDNYRKLPSYTGDAANDLAWRTGDARYTQIGWDEMIRQNRMAGGEALYALEERAERLMSVRGTVMAENRSFGGLTLRAGVDYSFRSSRSFKVMRDLLGARYLTDIDYFLIDDNTYGNSLQNNLLAPDRRIGEGDRFGYDYTLRERHVGARFSADYRADRFQGALLLALGSASIVRVGHYEKELFRGNGSLGRSRRVNFAAYTVQASAGWNFSPKAALTAALFVAAAPPDAADIFFQPQYNNRLVDTPECERSLGLELRYRHAAPMWRLQAAAYALQRTGGMETYRYYDDMAGLYADLSAVGIGIGAYGAEVAAEVDVASSWRLSGALSAGRAKYIRNPLLTILSDADNLPVDVRSESRMGGCDVGGAPRFTAVVGAGYFNDRGWSARMSVGCAVGRRVEPSPVRRTARITGMAAMTPETFDAFTRQERLRDAVSVDAALFKRFDLGETRLRCGLMLRNLLGSPMLHSGRESSRVRRVSVGDESLFVPHATSYMWSAPRSCYITVSYEF